MLTRNEHLADVRSRMSFLALTALLLTAPFARAHTGINPCDTATPVDYYGRSVKVLRLFGQANIGDAGRNEVTGNGIYHAPGVIVDHNSPPGRLYIYVVDSGNNRLLGFNIPSPLDTTVVLDGTRPADLVFGQPDFTSSSCNGDDNLGFTHSPSTSCLCLLGYPLANNTAEAWMRLNIDVDANGNLYVPDTYNNRVLRYNAPFSSDHSGGKGDAVADQVWGQDDMVSNGRNRGSNYGDFSLPDDHSLWISGGAPYFDHVSSRGVSADTEGNVWVADTFNSRVLRFPPNVSHADLVLGQPDFTSWGPEADTSLTRMNTPTLARVNPETGELWVLDENAAPFMARLLVFTPPFHSGMAASRTMTPQQSGPFSNWGGWDGSGTYRFQCTGFIFNTYRQGAYANGVAWMNELTTNRTILIDASGAIIAVVGAPDVTSVGGDLDYWHCDTNIYEGNHLWSPGGSLGIDRANNLYLADDFFHTVYRYALPYTTHLFQGYTCLPDANGVLFPKGPNRQSRGRLGEAVGIAVYGNQLLVLDEGNRLKVYDDYADKPFGADADHVVSGGLAGRAWLSPAVDESGRLWMSGEWGQTRIYQLPITSDSQAPIADFVRLYWADTHQQVTRPDGSDYIQVGAMAFDTTNHALYIADANGSRIFRVHNYERFADSLFVDMVLGQTNRAGVECNQGLSAPTASTMCTATLLKVDRQGNLFVVDNAYECHPNARILVFRALDLANAVGMFPDTPAWKVFNAPSFNEMGNCGTLDAPGSPVSLAFDSHNHMVVGNDGYYSDLESRALKQLWYYADPLAKQTPDASIALYMGTPGDLAFDGNDNLLVQDHTWYRVTMLNLDCDPEWLTSLPAGVETPAAEQGVAVTAYPNPARIATDISYALRTAARVSIAVYDVAGRQVHLLDEDAAFGPGRHTIRWDLRAADGNRVPAGLYLCRISVDGMRAEHKILVIR